MSGATPGARTGASRREETPGVRFRSETPLVAQAVALVEQAPRPSVELARRVLGLRAPPPALAERLVRELLGGDPRLRVDAKGVWRPRPVGRAGSCRLDELSWAVVDVETTGGGPGDGGRMVEIAVVRVQGGRVRGEFSSLVNPGTPVQPWVSRLTGIGDRDLADAPRFGEVEPQVRRELEGRVFVAHNAAFDWRFLSQEFRRTGGPLPSGPRVCTMRLARRALPGLERRGLDALAAYYGIEVRPRHRAAGDALATARILLRLLEKASRQGVERWGELRTWLRGAARRDGADASTASAETGVGRADDGPGHPTDDGPGHPTGDGPAPAEDAAGC